MTNGLKIAYQTSYFYPNCLPGKQILQNNVFETYIFVCILYLLQ